MKENEISTFRLKHKQKFISFKLRTSPALFRSHKYRASSSFLNLLIHVSDSSDSFFITGFRKGCETGLIFKELGGSLGAEVSAVGFSGCRASSRVFYQNNKSIGNTFTTQSFSNLLAKDEAIQLARFTVMSGFVKLGGWVSSPECYRTTSVKPSRM